MISITRSVQAIHGQTLLVDPAWQHSLAKIGISDDLPWSELELGQRVSGSPHSSCFRIELNDGEVVYFKRYIYPPKRWFEFMLRPGKAAVEAWAYATLQQLGIPTLEVVAFGERRILGALMASFIVTREVPDSQDMSNFGPEVWYQLPQDERKQVHREISGKLVSQIQRAHQADFFHHDLKWRNILLQKNDDGFTPVWIDAPRASQMRLRRRRGAVVDLSGLARIAISLLSKYDRMRFVWQYLGDAKKPGDAARLYRDVARHLGRRMPTKNVLPEEKT
jgi:tRNA A-37 threonylcarbamoyl transferase component Bud32